MRRFTTSLVSKANGPSGRLSAAAATSYPGALTAPKRQFHSVFGIIGSLTMCGLCMAAFGSWANNICNVRKYGLWRFRNTIDDVIMVSDFRGARYIGAFFGLLFWWFVVGPQKYRWDSTLDQVPGNIRLGPF